MELNNLEKPFSSEEESGFDIMEWASYFLNNWYLFVIGIIVSLGLAYVENRSWLPSFQTEGRVLIDENHSTGNSSEALMQGFGTQSGYKNVKNQVIMLGSNDLVSKVVDSLPFMKVDYISKGSFKTRNLYKTTPIVIQADYIAPEAYGVLFKIKLRSNGSYTISVDENNLFSKFQIDGRYGQPIQHNLFFLTVNNVDRYMGKTEMYFKFRTKESLISDFANLVESRPAFRESFTFKESLNFEVSVCE